MSRRRRTDRHGYHIPWHSDAQQRRRSEKRTQKKLAEERIDLQIYRDPRWDRSDPLILATRLWHPSFVRGCAGISLDVLPLGRLP